MSTHHNLRGFLAAVARRIDAAIDDPLFHPSQRALLQATVKRPRARSDRDPLGDPLSLTYLIARAHGRRMDAQAEHVGAFCLLYVLGLDLFDDVQDDDLAGTPHAEAGEPIAINSAITLTFLAVDQLRRALALEPDPDSRQRYLDLLSRVSLRAAAGQHRDLMGSAAAGTPAEVLDNQLAKTSSVSLLAECGALLGGCGEADRRRYRRVGERMALFVQVRDDLRDIYGKASSPDLKTGTVTYPLACFYQHADAKMVVELEQLRAGLPQTMQALRDLIYRSGAVEHAAAALERFREDIHTEIAAIDSQAAPLRTLLDIVDALAESVYEPPPIAATTALWCPAGRWHAAVRAELGSFVERTAALGLPPPPAVRPWHLPHWMYAPAKRTICYPDIEDQGEEILPFQAMLLGERDLDRVAQILETQLPAVLAHEMFHFWRHQSGRLSADHWHEEWAANRLAVAYAAAHEPAALSSALQLADRVIAQHGERLGEQAERVLRGCHRPDGQADGYGMDMVSVAVLSLEMIRRLAAERPRWPQIVASLLAPTAEPAGAAL